MSVCFHTRNAQFQGVTRSCGHFNIIKHYINKDGLVETVALYTRLSDWQLGSRSKLPLRTIAVKLFLFLDNNRLGLGYTYTIQMRCIATQRSRVRGVGGIACL